MTDWRDVCARRALCVALACALLLICASASSAYASAGFGIERYGFTATEENNSADTQAGSHPYELTAEAVLEPNAHNTSGDEVRSLDFELPAGLIVNPAAVAQDEVVGSVQVGVAGMTKSVALYSLAPAPGELGRFGFSIEGVSVIADISVRTGSDYGMTLSIRDLPQQGIESVKLTLGGLSAGSTFLTLPTSCAGPLQTTLRGESWGGQSISRSSSLPQLAGCDRLPFVPALNVAPLVTQPDEPSGYLVQLSMPQNESPEGLFAAQLRDATVVFPAGVTLGPSWMEGLVGCSEVEFGLASAQLGTCPAASTIGTVRLQTPLLSGSPEELEGHLYMATPNANPFGVPLALYLEAQGSGLLVKLAGQLTQNPATGQLTLSFEDLPQLSFSDIELAFFGGHTALLASPPTCGVFTATSDLVPWSASPDAVPSASFQIDAGAGGGPCPGPSSSSPAPTTGSGPTSTEPNAAVTLDGTRIATTKSGKASIELACAGISICRGKLMLTIKGGKSRGRGKSLGRDGKVRSKTIVIGTATFSIPAGKSTIVALNLNAAGRALLGADRGHLDADLAILGLEPGLMRTHIESVRLVAEKAVSKER
jgi:hypothetical protein